MTPNQRQRQDKQYRSSGRYAKVNPCYRCGQSAGVDYYSGPFVDRGDPTGRCWNDEMLCTCAACSRYLHALAEKGDYEQIAAEVDGGQWGKLPMGRSEKHFDIVKILAKIEAKDIRSADWCAYERGVLAYYVQGDNQADLQWLRERYAKILKGERI